MKSYVCCLSLALISLAPCAEAQFRSLESGSVSGEVETRSHSTPGWSLCSPGAAIETVDSPILRVLKAGARACLLQGFPAEGTSGDHPSPSCRPKPDPARRAHETPPASHQPLLPTSPPP